MRPQTAEPSGGISSRSLGDWVLSRLARVTSSGSFLPEVDGLRFFAIASVVVYHVSMLMPHPLGISFSGGLGSGVSSTLLYLFDRGFFGVRLFFVISGFILALPFASHYLRGERKPSLRSYYLRRVTRLEPPYIISLLICYLLLMMGGLHAAFALARNLAASLVYAHQLVFWQIPRVNGVLWSLECEVQFYMLAPLLALMFKIRSPLTRRLALAGVPLAVWGLLWGLAAFRGLFDHVPWYHPAHAAGFLSRNSHRVFIFDYLAYFCAGFILADVFVVAWKACTHRRLSWDVAGLAAWLALAFFLGTEDWERSRSWRDVILYPGLTGLGFAAAIRGRVSNLVVRNRWLATIGGMCYTIYLYHQVVIRALLPHTLGYCPNIFLQAAFYSVLCLVLSSFLFVLFEKPFMYRDWPERWRANLAALVRPRPGTRESSPSAPSS